MRIATILLAAGSLTGVSFGQPVLEPISAERELFVIACGFDYEFNECDGARESSSAASGYYGETIVADLDDYYGPDIADAYGWLDTNITPTSIDVEYIADAEVVNGGIFSADAGVYAESDIEFEFLDDVRVVFGGYAESFYQAYFVAGASLREVGGPVYASFVVQGGGDDDDQFTGWLYAGTYSIRADLDASAFFGMPAAGELNAFLRVYHKTDYNTNGTVDFADLSAFYAAYSAGSPAADYNGRDGVTSADLSGFVNDWLDATSS